MNRKKGFIAAAAASLLALGTASSASAATSIAACSKLINAESLKVQSAYLKGFGKCNDAFRKDAAKPPTPAFSKAAPACQKEIDKAEATAVKEHAKLSLAAPAKSCSDTDLQLLGHLPTSYGSRWATNVVVYAIQSAYDEQISATRDWINMLNTMGDVGSCADCDHYAVAPCQEHSCTYLGGSSSANVHLPGEIPVPLTGVTGFRICGAYSRPGGGGGNLLSGVTTANEFVTFGESGRQLQPAPIPGVGFACVRGIGAEGYITCNAGAAGLHVNYQTCQDHNTDGVTNVAGAAASGDCAGLCNASTDDTGQAGTGTSAHPGVTNGGACVATQQSNAVAGDAFIINTTQIAVVLTTQIGADAKPCTNDDTNSSDGSPASTSLTTGTASSAMKNPNDSADADIEAGPISGAPFNCGNIQSSNLSGASIVGAFPALHAITLGASALDSVTDFTIACE